MAWLSMISRCFCSKVNAFRNSEGILTQTHEIEYLGRFPSLIALIVMPSVNQGTRLCIYGAKPESHILDSKVMTNLSYRSPTTLMTGCSILKSWLNAETWMDDRLRPCIHISLVSQSHILIAGISTRVGKQQQCNPTSFLGSNYLFLKFNYINYNVSEKNITWLA